MTIEGARILQRFAKEDVETWIFVSHAVLATLDQCSKVIGQQPVKSMDSSRRLHGGLPAELKVCGRWPFTLTCWSAMARASGAEPQGRLLLLTLREAS